MNSTISKLQTIKDNQTYKQVLADSFGGIMYNVANRGKYNATHVLELWDSLDQREKNSVDGIMKGAINFLQGN